MNIGQLRHRVAIQQRVETQGAGGDITETWTDVATDVAAKVYPLNGSEYPAADAPQAELKADITIRYMDGLAERMRVVWQGRHYNIRGIVPDPTGARWLRLQCTEGANAG